jgi:hypothetical protein
VISTQQAFRWATIPTIDCSVCSKAAAMCSKDTPIAAYSAHTRDTASPADGKSPNVKVPRVVGGIVDFYDQ